MSRGINAKDELIAHIDGRPVKCIHLHGREYNYDEKKAPSMFLPVGHTQEQFDQFVAVLDVEYDNGYGGQNLYGHIWYVDGTWSERGEYDGSEWWDYKTAPELPEGLDQLTLGHLV